MCIPVSYKAQFYVPQKGFDQANTNNCCHAATMFYIMPMRHAHYNNYGKIQLSSCSVYMCC